MAFSTYEEFRAACADPKRVLTVYHQVFMQTAAAALVGQITPLKLWTTTSPLSAGGALLNHTSTPSISRQHLQYFPTDGQMML